MRPLEVFEISEHSVSPIMEMSETRNGITQTGYSQPPQTRPRPGRRGNQGYNLRVRFVHTLAWSLLVLLSLCGSIHAADAGTRANSVQKIRGRFVRGDITFDEWPAPEPAIFRRVEASSIPAPVGTDTATNPSASASQSSGSTPTSIESASADPTSPLPTPFDGGLGTNYTQPSCPIFLKKMIDDNNFIPCLPFSLLLQNSMSFFSATKSLSSISATLNVSCNIDFHTCSTIMSSYARTLRSSSACEQDYERQQPLLRQAYNGLLSYDVLYKASCIKPQPSSEQDSGNYCFANAVTNLSSPTDSYVYYLPLGIPLPAGSLPTCDTCLKEVMDVFAAAASNKSQPLSRDYVNAAQQTNQHCGPSFVNGTIPNVGASGSGQTSSVAPQVYRPDWGLPAVMFLTAMLVGL